MTVLLAAGNSFPASAEVRLSGDARAVHLVAVNASVAEVLDAFGKKFNVRYSSAIPLDKTIDRSFQGPIKRVVGQLLDGYNYVVKSGGASIEVFISGTRGDRPIAGAPTPNATRPSLAKQWRTVPKAPVKP